MGKRLSFGIVLSFGIAIVGSAVLSLPATQPAVAQETGAYAGGEVCLECHADMADTLAPTPHGKGGFGKGPRFEDEFQRDIMPYIDSHYRTLTDRKHRAIAGLSMGGAQALTVAIARPKDFAYVGVFSSGLFGVFTIPGRGAPPPAWTKGSSEWERRNAAALADERTKKGLKLLWFSTGTDDFLLQVTRSTVNLFKEYGYAPVYKESGGGHTWINWRDYLSEFAPLLFR